MQHAFIMDPIEGVKAYKDTTYYLMLACAERGHRVCYLDQRQLWLRHDELHATVTWLEVNADIEHPFTVVKQESLPMAAMDAIWVRTDPPFDRRYFYTTLLLDYLPETTRVLNRPSGIRNWNEKLAALVFPEFTPQTRVTSSVDEIQRFAEEEGRITVKPVDGFGGKGIVFFSPGDDASVLHQATHNEQHWVIAQEYLPAASEGDKRILILEGEPLGGILRVHAEGVELNNLDAGGTANPVDLTERDLEICRALKPDLEEQGIFFVGIDVIGGMLIEVNVTSPTGLQEMSRFADQKFHHRIIEALES
ncbi:MAG: glutathione synthase [Pseudomonadota bacterium]